MDYERTTCGNFNGQCPHYRQGAKDGDNKDGCLYAPGAWANCADCVNKERYDRLKIFEDAVENETARDSILAAAQNIVIAELQARLEKARHDRDRYKKRLDAIKDAIQGDNV